MKDGALQPEDITPDVFDSYLDTRGIPDPDLLIRTSGEERLSNFLLWQLAYSNSTSRMCSGRISQRRSLWKAIEQYNGRGAYGGVEKKEDGDNV